MHKCPASDQPDEGRWGVAPIGPAGRTIYVLFVGAAYSALVALPTLAVFALLGGVQLPLAAALLCLAPALAMDLCSLYLHTTHLVRGGGPAGQAGLSWFVYATFALDVPLPAWWDRIALLAGLTALHVCCHWYAPLALSRRLGRRPLA
jgi:hypothetical protein